MAGPPKPPASIGYLHRWLQQLHARSGIGAMGFARLSHLEIEAWARLRRIRIREHEIDALLQLDDVMLAPPKGPPKAPKAGKADG